MKLGSPLPLIFALATLTIVNAPALSETSESILPFPENFLVDGIPAPSKSLVAEIEPYNYFRYADLQSWHPMQREMLIATRFSDTSQIHLVKFPGGARTQLTFFKDPPNLAAFEPTSGELFTFEKDSDGNENSQKYLFDLRNHKSTLLSDGKSRNNGGMWSNKGDRYCYLSTRRNGEDDDAYIVFPRTPGSDHLAAQCKGGEWDTFDWSPDDSTVLLSQFVSLEQRNLYLMDSSSGALTLLTPDDGKGKIVYGGGKFSKDNLGVFTTTDKDSDFQRLAYIDLKTRKHTYLSTNIPWDIEQFALSWDGKTIAAVANEDGLSTLHLFDTASRKEKPAPELPKGIISSLSWHKNNQDLGFTFENARSQPDVYSVNLSSGKLERWTQSETGDVDTATLSDARLFHWKAFDNRQLSGFVYMPPVKFAGKRPVMINIHGGPVAQSRPEFLGRNNYYLNELGVAIVYPNVRGSTGYGKKFMGLDNVLKREDAYKDIESLLDWVKQQPDLDGERIMITGGSYGGHMTLACATLFSDKIKCAIDEVGQANFVTQLENTAPYGREIRRAEYGDERDPLTRAFLLRIAPVNNASKITKPLMVVAGRNDPRVPASESEQIVRAVKATGTPVWSLMAKDEGHGFHKKKNQDYLFYAKVEFVKKYLLN